MKRKSLFLISTFTFLNIISCLQNPVHAEVVYNDKTYYTLADLLKIEEEVEVAKISECGENYDYDCGEDVFWRLYQTSEKYKAYGSIKYSNMVFSAINPSENTAKFFYRDTDPMFPEEANRRYELEELYIYWLDPAIDLPTTYGYGQYADMIRNNTYNPDEVHVLFKGDQPSDFDWLTPNQESVIKFNENSVYSSTQELRIYAKSNGYSYGVINGFATCLASDEYKDGKECTKIYDGNTAPFFIPLAIESVEPEVGSSDIIAESEINPEPDTPDADRAMDPDITIAPESVPRPEEKAPETIMGDVLAPDTGAVEQQNSRRDSFTWWPIFVIIAEIALIAVCMTAKNRGKKH